MNVCELSENEKNYCADMDYIQALKALLLLHLGRSNI